MHAIEELLVVHTTDDKRLMSTVRKCTGLGATVDMSADDDEEEEG